MIFESRHRFKLCLTKIVTWCSLRKLYTYVFLKNIDDPQISRWALICQNVDLTINYIRGEANASDLLSRIEYLEESDKNLDIEVLESQLDFCGSVNTGGLEQNMDIFRKKI